MTWGFNSEVASWSATDLDSFCFDRRRVPFGRPLFKVDSCCDSSSIDDRKNIILYN